MGHRGSPLREVKKRRPERLRPGCCGRNGNRWDWTEGSCSGNSGPQFYQWSKGGHMDMPGKPHKFSLYLRAKKQNNTTRLCDSKDSLQEIIFYIKIWSDISVQQGFFAKVETKDLHISFLCIFLLKNQVSNVKVFPAHHLSSLAFLL